MKTNSTHDREPWMTPMIDEFERIEAPARPEDRQILERMALVDRPRTASPSRWTIGFGPSKLQLRRLAVAAAVLIVAGLLAGILLPRGRSANQAFAQVLTNLQNVQTAVMDAFITGPNQTRTAFKLYLKNPGYMRQELENGVVTVYDLGQHKLLTLVTTQRQATITDIATASQPAGNAAVPFDLISGWRDIPADRAKLIEEVVENGRRLAVYELSEHGMMRRIWVDRETMLPVRIRYRGSVQGNTEPSDMLYENIQWNAPLNDSLFAMKIPEGYESTPTIAAAPGPNDLVRLLRLWTTLSGGEFPEEFQPTSMYQLGALFGRFDQRVREVGEDRAVAYARIGQAVGMDVQRMEQKHDGPLQQEVATAAARGAIYLAIAIGRDWHWLGKGAHLGDANRIVAYWKTEDGGRYHALDANLRVLELEANQLPATRPAIP